MQFSHDRYQKKLIQGYCRIRKSNLGNSVCTALFQTLLFAWLFCVATSQAALKDSNTFNASPRPLLETSKSLNIGGGYVLLNDLPTGGMFFDFDYHWRIAKYMAIGGLFSTQFVVINNIPLPVFPILLDVRCDSYNKKISPIMQFGFGGTIIPIGDLGYTLRAASGIMTSLKNGNRFQFLLGYQMIGGYQVMGAGETAHCFGIIAGYHFFSKKRK